MSLILTGFLVSMAAGLATGLGAIPVFSRSASEGFIDAMLGFAAGIMLAVTTFDLFIPAMEPCGMWVTLIGFVVGAVFLGLLDRLAPHIHLISSTGLRPSSSNSAWLVMPAVAVHNLPKGLAVGISFGLGELIIEYHVW